MVRPTLAHGVMLLAGLVTFVLVASALAQRSATVEVVVAAASVQVGTPAAQAEVDVVDVDAGSTVVASLVRPGDLTGDVVLGRRLEPGEPLLRTDLVPATDRAGLRTIALPVERLVIDGLGLRSGDRIDVIAVSTDGSSRYVVADVGVARLPGEVAMGLGRAVETSTTWLTVSVSDAQLLDLAAALGSGEIVVARSTGALPVEVVSKAAPAAALTEGLDG